jgi:hypothetical protein
MNLEKSIGIKIHHQIGKLPKTDTFVFVFLLDIFIIFSSSISINPSPRLTIISYYSNRLSYGIIQLSEYLNLSKNALEGITAMKKTIIIILLTMFLFIPVKVFQTTEASLGGQLLLNEKKLMEQVAKLEHSDYIKHIIVVPTVNDHDEEVVNMIERISRIHPTILEKVVENNIRIKLFTGSLTDQPGFTHLKGIKPRGYERFTWDDVPGTGGSKLALAKIGHSVKGKGHGSINLELHELAHSIDKHVFHSLRDDSEFKNIWKEEASLLFPGQLYFIDNPEEYFAEVFAMYYLGSSPRLQLYSHAPKTYHYLKQLETREEDGIQLAVSFH